MKKLLIILILFTAQSLAFSQFKKEIKEIKAKGGYFLGYQECDTDSCSLQVLLPASLDIRKVEAFYLAFAFTGRLTSYASLGGSNDYLWTDKLIGVEKSKGKTHLLIRIHWKYSEELWEACDLCALGAFYFIVYKNFENEYLYAKRIDVRGEVNWQRK